MRNSDELLEQALAISGLGVIDLDGQTGAVVVTPRLREIFDWAPDQPVTVRDVIDRVHPDDRRRVAAVINRPDDRVSALVSLDYRLLLPDGTIRWLATTARRYFEGEGEGLRRVRTLGAVLDITERKQAEERLRASQERYALVERGVNDGVWDWNILTGEHYHSERWKEIVGSRDDALPNSESSFFDRIHQDDRETVRTALRLHLDEGARYEVEIRLRRSDGTYGWVLSRGEAVRDGNGLPIRMVGALTDIDQRKLTEEALRRSEERYALFERGVNDGLWDWDVVTGEHYHSPRWQEIVGSRDDAVPNTEASFFDRIHPDDRGAVTEALDRHWNGGARYAVEVRLRHRDGSYGWALSRGEAVRDGAGRPVRMVGALTDITLRKEAEEALVRAHDELEQRVLDRTRELQDSERALRALSASLLTAQEDERRRLARELHDDVTQQLAFISIEAGTLANSLPSLTEDGRARLHALQERIVQTARDVRRVSHGLHSGLIEDLGLGAALEAFCDEFAAARGLSVRYLGAADDTGVSLVAASTLYRVAQESVANAAKHAKATQVDVSLERRTETLTLVVKDDGMGFALSERRATAGLGLVSMQERMRLVSGTLAVTSGPGEGTMISATVPCGGGA